MDTVEKKYGLWTGIAMVVGIVIGSGVFLKAGGVLTLAGGSLPISLLAWLIGGLIMVASGFCFAIFANRFQKFNGVVDYVEISGGRRIAYQLAWLMTTLYYPTIASIVAVFASAYFLDLFGLSNLILGGEISVIYQLLSCWQTYVVAFGFITLFSILNFFAPKIAGKFQISATVVKLIPILVIALVGLFASIIKDCAGIGDAFTQNAIIDGQTLSVNFGEAVKKTSFAYEGWVCATIINAELKDSKKNLPRALVGGTIAIVLFYIIYYIGISSLVTYNTNGGVINGNAAAIMADANAPLLIFHNLMGVVGEKVFCVFIMISCLGTVNGVALSCSRGFYTMSCRQLGPIPEKVSKLDPKSNVSFYSSLFGYIAMVFMLILWFLANCDSLSLFGIQSRDWVFSYLGSMDEIVCALIYGTFIIMFVYMIRKFNDLNVFRRFVMPIIAIIGCSFFVLCGTGLFQLFDSIINNHGLVLTWGYDNYTSNSFYSLICFGAWLVLFVIISLPSLFFYRKDDNLDYSSYALSDEL